MSNPLSKSVLPVIDLQGCQVVRGVAGQRAAYRPIESQLSSSSNPGDVASGLQRRYGFQDVYVADLDAIAGQPPDVAGYAAIADAGLQLWIDAGTGCDSQLASLIREGTCLRRAIVGLESVQDSSQLRDLVAMSDYLHDVVFSLDLRHGEPLTSVRGWSTVDRIVQDVVDAGFQSLIVLDLAAVGVGGGPTTIDLCKLLHRRFPDLELISGGGIRDEDDVLALVAAGCARVLVASALHDGTLRP